MIWRQRYLFKIKKNLNIILFENSSYLNKFSPFPYPTNQQLIYSFSRCSIYQPFFLTLI